MNRDNALHKKVLTMTTVAFLSALVAVLQILSYVSPIKVGIFNMSFVLIPVVVGGILTNPKAGAFLGGVFGLVVTIACITGMDAGGNILYMANPFFCILICMVKGIACGFVPALVYKLISKGSKNMAAIILSSVLCPIVNTALFCVGLTVLYYDILVSWAGGTAVFYYMFTVLIGINFLIELAINIVLCPAISAVVFGINRSTSTLKR